VEVLIIGGGPAGSTLGFLLARAGYQVMLIEREPHPRDHVGELILPSVNMILHRIELLEDVEAAGFPHREGLAWTGPCLGNGVRGAICAADFPPPRALRRYGYNVERSAFDHILLTNAQRVGVRLVHGLARDVVFENGRAVGVRVVHDRHREELLPATFVVDASGRRCLLGSQLGYKVKSESNRQCAVYSWFRGAEYGPADGAMYAIVHHLQRERAWAWQIPLRNEVSSVGLVVDAKMFPRVPEEFDAWYRQVLAENPTVVPFLAGAERMREWIVEADYSYRLQRIIGPGWLLVGDAAGFIDPVFASGVDIAMHSAFFAYQALVPLLRLGRWNDDDEAFQLHRYEERLERGLTVWRRMVQLFYKRPEALATAASEPARHPALARLLQGNPYEVQNIDIAEAVFRALA
jgi:FADH2 O2-dependent halogenase